LAASLKQTTIQHGPAIGFGGGITNNGILTMLMARFSLYVAAATVTESPDEASATACPDRLARCRWR
jgi:hypothetical protein